MKKTLCLFLAALMLTACASAPDTNPAPAKRRNWSSIAQSEPLTRSYNVQKMTPHEQELLQQKLQEALTGQ